MKHISVPSQKANNKATTTAKLNVYVKKNTT